MGTVLSVRCIAFSVLISRGGDWDRVDRGTESNLCHAQIINTGIKENPFKRGEGGGNGRKWTATTKLIS